MSVLRNFVRRFLQIFFHDFSSGTCFPYAAPISNIRKVVNYRQHWAGLRASLRRPHIKVLKNRKIDPYFWGVDFL